jgi:hypothetical protein
MSNLRKHIKKKFLLEKKLTPEEKIQLDKVRTPVPWEEVRNIKRAPPNTTPLIFYDNDKMVLGFQYNQDGNLRWIPEPDPVLMYFNSAYFFIKGIPVQKKKFIKAISEAIPNDLDVINTIYDFFGVSSSAIIHLFTTLEAFINRVIPSEFKYNKITAKRTEIYDKSQTERFLSFDEKMNEVLKQVFPDKKIFKKQHPTIAVHLDNLKNFRDELIHLKAGNPQQPELTVAYENIYKKLLNYKYEEALNAVKEFCNYYHLDKNYIEECPCSNID